VSVASARIVFAGTPEFAAVILKALLSSPLVVAAVYTQPDRPAGRGRKLTPSPVKELALAHGLPVFQPLSLREDSVARELAGLNPDLMVVVGYGQILPRSILEIPKHDCVNVHASLLPRWRGAAPIQRAILAGDSETGVSIMAMAEGLDSGPVYRQARCPIERYDTAQLLHDRLARLGAELLIPTLEAILARQLRPEAQDESRVTYASKIQRAEAELDWNQRAIHLERKVRGFNPKPVAFARLEELEIRIWEAFAIENNVHQPPGKVVRFHDGLLEVATGEGILSLARVQLPGKRPIAAEDFVNAHPRLAGLD
jgi:methionyl-tRNA formyltransferase